MLRGLLGGIIMLTAATGAVSQVYEDQGFVSSEMITVVETPKAYPVADLHAHMAATEEAYDLAVKSMDAAGIAVTFNLSGGSGESLDKHLELSKKYPGRFVQFCGVRRRRDPADSEDIGEAFAQSIQESYDKGARGFGEVVKWSLRGGLAWDDERLEPMWDKLEELQMPINWHAGDPSRYWRPGSSVNTLEDVSYYRNAPLKQTLLNQQERVLERHPNLVVIASHSNYLSDSIPLLVYRFEKYPNYHIDVSASLGEWGRVPEEFVDICNDYSDRIFYGTDASYRDTTAERLGGLEQAVADFRAFHLAHILFLSTSQKSLPIPFNGNYGRTLAGRVNGFTRYIHDGVALSDEVLEDIYYKNAERLFGIEMPEIDLTMWSDAAEE